MSSADSVLATFIHMMPILFFALTLFITRFRPSWSGTICFLVGIALVVLLSEADIPRSMLFVRDGIVAGPLFGIGALYYFAEEAPGKNKRARVHKKGKNK